MNFRRGLSSAVSIIFAIIIGIIVVVMLFVVANAWIPWAAERAANFVCNFPILDVTICKAWRESQNVKVCLTQLGGWGQINEGVREERNGWVVFAYIQPDIKSVVDLHCMDGDTNRNNKECWLGVLTKNNIEKYYMIKFESFDVNNKKLGIRVHYNSRSSYKDTCHYEVSEPTAYSVFSYLGKDESLKTPDGLSIKLTNLNWVINSPAGTAPPTVKVDFTFELLFSTSSISVNVFDTQGCIDLGGSCHSESCDSLNKNWIGYCDNNQNCCV